MIKSKAEYLKAMARLEESMGREPYVDSEFAPLVNLIEDYEVRTVDLGPLDPVEAIKFRAGQEAA